MNVILNGALVLELDEYKAKKPNAKGETNTYYSFTAYEFGGDHLSKKIGLKEKTDIDKIRPFLGKKCNIVTDLFLWEGKANLNFVSLTPAQ